MALPKGAIFIQETADHLLHHREDSQTQKFL